MTQVDIGLFVDSETGVLDEQKLTRFITRYRIGSLFNTPFAGHSGRWASLPEAATRRLLLFFSPKSKPISFDWLTSHCSVLCPPWYASPRMVQTVLVYSCGFLLPPGGTLPDLSPVTHASAACPDATVADPRRRPTTIGFVFLFRGCSNNFSLVLLPSRGHHSRTRFRG